MKLISHRGNVNGKFEGHENEPTYIDLAINKGYDVEIDVWVKDGLLFLGHDKPVYGINFKWIIDRITKLWVHCKNIEALLFFNNCNFPINYFWHENDTVTLTSKGHIWAFPGKQPIFDSIAVMPEINNDKVDKCYGICSDYIEKYKI
jgi:hypothetical protein